MKKNYKIVMIGLGSIGMRHLNNMATLFKYRDISYTIDLVRHDSTKPLDEKIKPLIHDIYYSIDSMPNDYDIAFITNPTDKHFETVSAILDKTVHMFIEKPIFDHLRHPLHALSFNKHGVYYVACPLRYTNVIQYLKETVDPSSVFSARIISSSYLPDWRPDTDYRQSYSASANQGGGVSIDLIHEWDYILYLFGRPKEVLNFRGRFSNLEIDSDDLSIYIARYEKMLVEVHLDYFGRKPVREIQLFTESEQIVGDLIKSEIRYEKSGEVISFHELRNDYQMKEIEAFFDMIEGKLLNHNSVQTALSTLSIAKDGIIL